MACKIRTLLPRPARLQTDVEETIERIKGQKGVEGFFIVDDEGTLLRCKKLSKEGATKLAADIVALVNKAKHSVRDIDPTVRPRLQQVCIPAHSCLHLCSCCTLSAEHSPLLPHEESGHGGVGGARAWLHRRHLAALDACCPDRHDRR